MRLRFSLQLRLQRLPRSVVRSALGLPPQEEEGEEEEAGPSPEEEEEEEEDRRSEGARYLPDQTDGSCLLRSQNSSEQTPLNSLASLTNGFPRKGVSQTAHKIRVDFKVSLLPPSFSKTLHY